MAKKKSRAQTLLLDSIMPQIHQQWGNGWSMLSDDMKADLIRAKAFNLVRQHATMVGAEVSIAILQELAEEIVDLYS